MRFIWTFLLAVLLFACSEPANPQPVPDFSDCECGFEFEPVCGVDGRSYYNACLAECLGVGIADSTGNCDSSMIVLSDTLTWPIQQVCFPIPTPQTPAELYALSDGSIIYESPDGTLFRGNRNLCRCLSPTVCIDAPGGGIELWTLTRGDSVFSLDEAGREVVVPVMDLQKVPVGEEHRLVHLTMNDGSSLMASPMHPIADGRLLGDIHPGDIIEGREVKTRTWRKTPSGFTMDLLPLGPTSVYRIGGYWYQTTMTRAMVSSR
ncbi:MAG: Kazal-type serine protease inhibitor domain-containing protein [Bacteroidota bacterium]